MARRTFTVFSTRHASVVRKQGDQWVSVSLMQNPVNALIQSYSRTKAKDYAAFRKIMDLHSNSSNNTIFADASGNIAYFHSNYIPRRDTTFDWTKPVDGSNPATDYHGLLSIEETPGLLDPASGWLYNSNNWPWSAAGWASPKQSSFPAYVETGMEETPRGYHALRVLADKKDFTMDALMAAAFDSYLPAFERLLPPLLQAYDHAPDSVKTRFADQIAALRDWDYRWSATSVPTSLAVFWGQVRLRRVAPEARDAGMSALTYATDRATPAERLRALAAACALPSANFATWQMPPRDIH